MKYELVLPLQFHIYNSRMRAAPLLSRMPRRDLTVYRVRVPAPAVHINCMVRVGAVLVRPYYTPILTYYVHRICPHAANHLARLPAPSIAIHCASSYGIGQYT
jgi:hypothetical protein